jgi:hypothetical protein
MKFGVLLEALLGMDISFYDTNYLVSRLYV